MRLTDALFSDLSLPDELKAGLAACGYERLTDVQAASLPITLTGRDLAVQAQTGSGKTAVFLVTAFAHMLKHPRRAGGASCPRALVITPTRELTVQVARDAASIGQFLPFRTLAVYGGVDYAKQRSELREGVDLVVGTPGRLIDYLKQKVYHLKDLEIAVIDEADRLFDMGFIADVRFLLRRMSSFERRQSLLFSATLGLRVMELAYDYMNVPDLVEISPEQITAELVEQSLFHVGAHEKFNLFLGLLGREEWSKALVFVNTKREARQLRDRLEANGYPAMLLSGDVDQVRRLKILRKFMTGDVRILVATDVASRGLHIEAISHVFNYDVPQDAEDYVHRIGRTARSGASGKAITLADENYVLALDAIEKFIGREIPVDWADDSLFVAAIDAPRRPHRARRDDDAAPRARRDRDRGRRPSRGTRESGAEAAATPARTPPSGDQTATGEGAPRPGSRRRRRPRGPKRAPAAKGGDGS
jgi:ATP-dependent RNA helicase RhlB